MLSCERERREGAGGEKYTSPTTSLTSTHTHLVFWTVEWEYVSCNAYLLHKVCSNVGEVIVSDDGRVGLGAKQLLVHSDKEGGRPT